MTVKGDNATKLQGLGLTPQIGRPTHAQHFVRVSNTLIISTIPDLLVAQLR